MKNKYFRFAINESHHGYVEVVNDRFKLAGLNKKVPAKYLRAILSHQALRGILDEAAADGLAEWRGYYHLRRRVGMSGAVDYVIRREVDRANVHYPIVGSVHVSRSGLFNYDVDIPAFLLPIFYGEIQKDFPQEDAKVLEYSREFPVVELKSLYPSRPLEEFLDQELTVVEDVGFDVIFPRGVTGGWAVSWDEARERGVPYGCGIRVDDKDFCPAVFIFIEPLVSPHKINGGTLWADLFTLVEPRETPEWVIEGSKMVEFGDLYGDLDAVLDDAPTGENGWKSVVLKVERKEIFNVIPGLYNRFAEKEVQMRGIFVPGEEQ